jgi:hypothetical protein
MNRLAVSAISRVLGFFLLGSWTAQAQQTSSTGTGGNSGQNQNQLGIIRGTIPQQTPVPAQPMPGVGGDRPHVAPEQGGEGVVVNHPGTIQGTVPRTSPTLAQVVAASGSPQEQGANTGQSEPGTIQGRVPSQPPTPVQGVVSVVRLHAPQLSRQGFTCSVFTESGHVYVLEYKDGVNPKEWISLGAFTGTGGSLKVVDSSPSSAYRIYRLRQE